MKRVLSTLTSVILVFGIASLAAAALATQQFYVEIDAVSVGPLCPGVSDVVFVDPVEVGQKFYGAVTYDNASIPRTGSYVVGENVSGPWDGSYEPQLLSFSWASYHMYVNGGTDNSYEWAFLSFENGKTSGMEVWWVPDFSTGTNQVGINGTHYWAYGEMMYMGSSDGTRADFYAPYNLAGTVHFPVSESTPTPIPGAFLLFAPGLAAIVLLRRRLSKRD